MPLAFRVFPQRFRIYLEFLASCESSPLCIHEAGSPPVATLSLFTILRRTVLSRFFGVVGRPIWGNACHVFVNLLGTFPFFFFPCHCLDLFSSVSLDCLGSSHSFLNNGFCSFFGPRGQILFREGPLLVPRTLSPQFFSLIF